HSTFVLGAASARADCTALASRASPRSLLYVELGFATSPGGELPYQRRVASLLESPVNEGTDDSHRQAGLRGATVGIEGYSDVQRAALRTGVGPAVGSEAAKGSRGPGAMDSHFAGRVTNTIIATSNHCAGYGIECALAGDSDRVTRRILS